MEKKTEQKTFQTLEIYLSAFLSLHGIGPELQVQNGKVVFVFPQTDELYRLMNNFNANVNVPAADFVTHIKILRGKMLTLKGQK